MVKVSSNDTCLYRHWNAEIHRLVNSKFNPRREKVRATVPFDLQESAGSHWLAGSVRVDQAGHFTRRYMYRFDVAFALILVP